MTQQDFPAFAQLMQGIAECCNRALSARGVALYFHLLRGYAIDDVRAAALAILTTRKYTTLPMPADFLEYLNGGSLEDVACIEAHKVLEAIRQHGGYKSVAFDNAVTQAVIMRGYGGWARLCASCGVQDGEDWFQRQFVKLWLVYHRQGIRHVGHLAGRVECAGGQCPTPVLIGDALKALAATGGEDMAVPDTPEQAVALAQTHTEAQLAVMHDHPDEPANNLEVESEPVGH